ncbi:P-loop NTPase fold protein [Streptomyces sp. NRRL F-5123]|uniref:P-loop NTPase fold protein n=1 Tax=Streptomyces sp. NRRL F-5123 TaxID=1463856 RepID=UPI0004E1744D|nr:P-loop NTPase fold protein [Streptomyces sp. NRRL F-5123]
MTDTGSATGSAYAARPGGPPLQLVPLGGPVTSHINGVRSAAWTTGRQPPVLATGGGNGEIRLWQAGGSGLFPLGTAPVGHSGWVRSMAWAWDGERHLLATGASDGTVRLCSLDDGTMRLLDEPGLGHTSEVLSAAWAKNGERLLLATSDAGGWIRLWEAADNGLRAASPGIVGVTGEMLSLAWARDDRQLLLAGGIGTGEILLWHLGGRALSDLPGRNTGHTWAARSVAWAQDGEQLVLASGSNDQTIRLWGHDGASLRPLGEPATGHTDWVRSVAWARGGGRLLLASGSDDGTVRLWERVGDALHPLGEPATGHSGWVLTAAWAQHGTRLLLATGGNDGTVRLWEAVEDRAQPRIPAYRSDALGVPDALARSDDARALAELVTARSARPPLAVGLFGDWGEGKSHFLGLLQQQVDLVARAGNPLAHRDVRQVRFNAWHYAETGLWASLVAELFAQLTAPPGEDDPGEAQRSMSRLTAELVTARGLRPRLDAARARRDRLERALRERNLWDRLSPDQQQHIAELAEQDAVPARYYRQSAGGLAVVRERLLILGATVRGIGPVRVATFLAACVAVVAGGVLAARWWQWLPGWASGIPGAVPLLAGVAWIRGQAARTRVGFRQVRQAAQRIAEQQRAKLLTAAEVAAAEVAALERQMQDLTAAGQLAGLIGDRAAGADYRGQLGVMTQIREDFERMAELLGQAASPDEGAEAGARDEADDALPRIDRIIVYIDDLDRCPPARVVEMLEAIHLLLAVELFVVVVAIDPRWLLRAIAAHYRDVLDAAPGEGVAGLGASTPAQYLEKIFQVVLTLPALDVGGYGRMIDTLVGVRNDRTPPPSASGGAAASTAPGPTSEQAPDRTDPGPAQAATPAPAEPVLGDEDDMALGIPRVDALRVVERTDPLTLEPDELALLRLLGPPHLVATPRGVTRLANSYGLLTALRRTHREADLAQTAESGSPPYRAGMVLLAALVAYPALGPALCLHLHAEATARPGATWRDFCAALPPPAAPADTIAQWGALRAALLAVTQTATDHALLLPMPLTVWREWVLPVARLSFPAGSIVSTLHPGQAPA